MNMDVLKNRGGPLKSSILIGFCIINHPFWGIPIFENTHMNISNFKKPAAFKDDQYFQYIHLLRFQSCALKSSVAGKDKKRSCACSY